MKLIEKIQRSDELVKQISEGINQGKMSLKRAEEKIVEFVNCIGRIVMDEVIENIVEPVEENRVMVNGAEAVFSGIRNLRFHNRFGGQTVCARRCYKYVKKAGGWYPLDEKLGIDYEGRFSPLMSYLQALLGQASLMNGVNNF